MLNINVGVLGHVDSGKTSLAKVLSTVASTSAFDKNPQSKKRGITLDLGFSSFIVNSASYPFEPSIHQNFENVQFTLVDCPGHGSLIRTVLCGSQIIDVVILVVDVTKGFQTQTAECLVIGEITCKKMLVVLNKCDIFKQSKIAEISAAPEFTSEQRTNNSQEVENLITLLAQSISDPTENRNKLKDRSFIFAVDHCFTITGQGTILTGTVLSGTTSVGQTIGLPYQRIQKKIKSIQRFRQSIQSIGPGDRAGICVPQLDANLLERGLVGDITSTNNLTPCYACILSCVRKVSYFKSSIKSKSRLHIFVGQETVLANLTFFTKVKSEHDNANNTEKSFEFDKTAMYHYVEEIPNVTGVPYQDETAVQCFQVCKSKTRRGQIERVVNPRMCIVHGLFKRETNWEIFVGLRAYVIIKLNETNSTETQRINGYIESSFGQSGKCRLALDDLPDEILAQYSSKGGRKQVSQPDTEVVLEFKKNVFDPQRRIIQ
uniref:Elongation factor EFSec n=1 Tax=Schistosoma japonicum TaxID=6182 RepID=A0A4Y6GV37_SCHJA|nr:elongation factor EFSec [Schistosoma japonicum]